MEVKRFSRNRKNGEPMKYLLVILLLTLSCVSRQKVDIKIEDNREELLRHDRTNNIQLQYKLETK